ncbi:hypothetical protein FRC09_007690, partial [Ceratobasidium sp. 395]
MATDLTSRTDNELKDLDSSLNQLSQMLILIPDSHPFKPVLLTKLGVTYVGRFTRLGELTDLHTSHNYLSKAVSLTPDGHPEKSLRLHELCICYCLRFEYLGELEDLNQSVSCGTQALSLPTDNHPERLKWLNTLAISHRLRFDRLGEGADLEKSISYLAQLISLTPDEDPDRPKRLINQAAAHNRRFVLLGGLEDLEMSISCSGQAMALMSEDHSDRAAILNTLSISHHHRFQHLGDMNDLDKAQCYLNQALSLTPSSHANMPKLLDNLQMIHTSRYHRFGKLEDLNAIISHSNQALGLIPKEHPERFSLLGSSGASYYYRYEFLRELADLDNAIIRLNQAYLLAPVGHLTMVNVLGRLGEAYMSRFVHLEDFTDLDNAVTYMKEAISLTADGKTRKPFWLSRLGHCYLCRYHWTRSLSDLEMALDCFSRANSLIADDQTMKLDILDSIARLYTLRFELLGHPDDLDKALSSGTQALLLVSNDHPSKRGLLSTLSNIYRQRFLSFKDPACLDRAITTLEEAVSLAPDNASVKGTLLCILGDNYHCRYQLSKSSMDIKASITSLAQAAHLVTGFSRTRFLAAHTWAKIALNSGLISSSFMAYKHTIKLIPWVVWLGASVDQRYKQVLDVDRLAIEAAALAISLRKYNTALEWLEQGRSIIWGQLLQLRTPLDQLSAVDPSLAEEFRQVTQDLERMFAENDLPITLSSNRFSVEHISQRHRRLVENREQLITQIRTLPDLHDFLEPRKASHLVAAARNGPIVIIHTHESGCHALVICPQAKDIRGIPLPDLKQHRLVTARNELMRSLEILGRTSRQIVYLPEEEYTIEGTLGMLWSDLVKPVLDTLGYMKPSICQKDLPHITWCLTGALSFLPVHAAGDYTKPGCSLFDYAISSFTPSVSALLDLPAHPEDFSGILAIGQAHTRGLTALPGTLTELDKISAQIDATKLTRLEGENATSKAVLAALDSRSWVHFACHASQNVTSPTESAFHLHDSSLNLATITRKQSKHADLAFLSACQTATGDTNLPEEAVHLAAGMIMAGYRRVIATL